MIYNFDDICVYELENNKNNLNNNDSYCSENSTVIIDKSTKEVIRTKIN